MRVHRAALTACLVLASCGTQQPTPDTIRAIVAEAMQRQAVATRLIDTRIGDAERWRLEGPATVTLLGDPRPDGDDAWAVRVVLRGRWSGLVVAPSTPKPTVDAEGLIQWPPIRRAPFSQAFDTVAEVRIRRDADGTFSVP